MKFICISCAGGLESTEIELVCTSCHRKYPVHNGIPLMREGSTKFQEYYDLEYSAENFHEEDTPIKLRKIFRLLPGDLRARRLLDLGCGAGQIGAAVAERVGAEETVFADLSVAAMSLIEAEGEKVVCSAGQIPLPDDSLDLTIMADVLEHLPEADLALKEQQRLTEYLLLKLPLDGALLRRAYIGVLQLRYGEDYWKKVYGHVNRYTRKTLLAVLDEHGFEPVVIDVSDEPSESATSLEKFLHGIQTLGDKLLPASWFEALFGGDITILARNRRRRSN